MGATQALSSSDPASLAIYAGVVGIVVLLSPVLGPLLGRVVRGYAGNVTAADALDQLNTVPGPWQAPWLAASCGCVVRLV
jgi:hypothetical protein